MKGVQCNELIGGIALKMALFLHVTPLNYCRFEILSELRIICDIVTLMS